MPRSFESKSTQVDETSSDSAWALFDDAAPAAPSGQRSTSDAGLAKPPDRDCATSTNKPALASGNAAQSPEPRKQLTATPHGERPKQVDKALSQIHQHHPAIASKLDLSWGTAECHNYLQKLLSDSYGREESVRSGFSIDEARALMILVSLHPETP